MRMRRIIAMSILGWSAVAAAVVGAQEKSVQPGINKTFQDPQLDVGQWTERFEKEGREIFDRRAELVAVCELRPGMAVADVGAGSGLFTRLFAETVGAAGRVYAVDIAEKFLEKIAQTCQGAGLTNVTTVLCSADDARLPPASVDLIFVCDTYHHFEFPLKTLASLHRALRPGGRLVIVDFKRVEGVSSKWVLEHVRAGQDVVTREIESSGFEFIDSQDVLKENYVLRFRKVEAPAEAAAPAATAAWRPVEGQLWTRWARDVRPDKVWDVYPRPQLVRSQWTSLNGLWDYAIQPRSNDRPGSYPGQILVPFAVQSALSGVKQPVGPDQRLWYRRRFEVPADARDKRLLLHFEAVDWHAMVWVNGRLVGEHRGGYDPFTFDITDALTATDVQEVVVGVWDPTDASFQPRGKQVLDPRGIWYTAVTGIWQTVWLEAVPQTFVASLRLTPNVDRGELHLAADVSGSEPGWELAAEVRADGQVVVRGTQLGSELTLRLPAAHLWSPDDPYLYDLRVTLRRADQVLDQVDSYFGMREIEVRKADDGFNRLFLNGRPLFQYGPLDQGWWPDGLYTAPTDEALRYDLEMTKQLGFNTIRKHVKVEPARWYYHCDRLGLMVWQDMPSGDRFIGGDDPDLARTPESAENFRREYQAMIDAHRNHPCIVAWVPFNEGWGQFETNAILAWTKEYDPTRLVDAPSGWADRGTGDMRDLHRYPGPDMPPPEANRAAVLGEFGGLGLPVPDHLWWDKRNWGYRTYATQAELQQEFERLIKNLRPLIGAGLAAAIYTQTTDVEGEVNGLMTYDRAVVKYDVNRLAELHRQLYLPPPLYLRTVILPTSEEQARTWRYTFEKPADGWEQPAFDDAGWTQGPGGFGRPDTPGAVVRTPWETSDIWLRSTIELQSAEFHDLQVRVHHDEDVEIYVNGQRAAALEKFTTRYEELGLDAAAAAAFRPGTNTIAVHCRQTGGGQYIDLGFVDVQEKAR